MRGTEWELTFEQELCNIMTLEHGRDCIYEPHNIGVVQFIELVPDDESTDDDGNLAEEAISEIEVSESDLEIEQDGESDGTGRKKGENESTHGQSDQS